MCIFQATSTVYSHVFGMLLCHENQRQEIMPTISNRNIAILFRNDIKVKKSSRNAPLLGITDIISVVFWVRSVYGDKVHVIKLHIFIFEVLDWRFYMKLLRCTVKMLNNCVRIIIFNFIQICQLCGQGKCIDKTHILCINLGLKHQFKIRGFL